MLVFDKLFITNKIPMPLKKEELKFCIKKAQSGDDLEKEKLIIHNIRLVLQRVYKRFLNTSYEPKELAAVGIFGLIKAIENFDLKKNVAFATYATPCIDNEILMFLRKPNSYVSLDLFVNNETDKKLEDVIYDEKSDIVENYEEKEAALEIRNQVELLKGRDKEIVKLFYGFYNDRCYSQKEIAHIFNMSQVQISRVLRKQLIIIANKMKEKDYIDKVNIGRIKSYNKKTNKFIN